MTQDSAVLTSLYGDSKHANQLSLLQELRALQVKMKRPSTIKQPWADGSTQQI